MKSTLFTFNLSIAGAVTIFGVAGAAQALTVVPTDLNPGEQYRLVFLTDGTRDATSSTIADYNTFVTGDVTGSQLETDLTLAGLTPDWFAIASTQTVSARDNTGTQGTGGVPIYLITGERVADNYGDFWDGSIQTAIDTTPDENTLDVFVWTGSLDDGSPSASGSLWLGPPNGSIPVGRRGESSRTDSLWIDSTNAALKTSSFSLYSISSVLTVPQAQSVPEPSSLLGFMTLGGLMLGGAVRRVKNNPDTK